MKLYFLNFSQAYYPNSKAWIFLAIILLTSGKLFSQIQPNQIGFPPDSSQIWILGTDTMSTSLTFGRGIWYSIINLMDSLGNNDEDWLKYRTQEIPTNTDTAYHQGIISIGSDSVFSGILNVIGRIDARFPDFENNSIMIGSNSGNNNLTGTNNIGIGSYALSVNTSGYNNTNIGNVSGYRIINGTNNTSIGSSAGQEATTGGFNVNIGALAGYLNEVGSANINIGFQAGNSYLGDNSIAIGYQSLLYNISGTGNTAIGDRALRNANSAINTAVGYTSQMNSSTGANNTSLGYQTLGLLTTGYNNVAVGGSAGYQGTSGANNVYIGSYSGYGAPGNTAFYNVGVGSSALNLIDSGGFNVAIGQDAAGSLANGNYNTVIGNTALYHNIDGEENIAIGSEALYLDTNTIGNNLAVGTKAMRNNLNGYNNLAVGNYAAFGNVSGFNNTVIGRNAAYEKTSGNNNVILGYFAAAANGGTTNTSENTILGSQAGFYLEGTGNVFIGRQAGYSESGSNKLYIENSTSSTPLLYGEFDNDLIKINGKLGYTTNGGSPTSISGRDGTYLSDVTTGYGLSLSSGTLKLDTTNIATLFDLTQIPISNLKSATATNTIDNGNLMQEWKWNSLVGGSGLKLTSTSPNAASNTQSLLDVRLTGTNTTASQLSHAGYFLNTHDGATPLNIGVYALATGDNGKGIYGVGGYAGVYATSSTSTGYGVYAQATNNYGLYSASTTSYGVYARSNTGIPLGCQDFSSSTNDVRTLFNLFRVSSGAETNGIGAAIDFTISADNSGYVANSLISKWIETNISTRTSNFIIQGVNNGNTSDRFIIGGDSTRVNGTFRASQMRTQWAQSSSSSVTLTFTSVNGLAMSGSGASTVELPNATSSTTGYWFNIANVGTGTVTVSAASGSSDTISGGILTLGPNESVIYECAADNHWIKN